MIPMRNFLQRFGCGTFGLIVVSMGVFGLPFPARGAAVNAPPSADNPKGLPEFTPVNFEHLWFSSNREAMAQRFLAMGDLLSEPSVRNLLAYHEDHGPRVMLPTDHGLIEGVTGHYLVMMNSTDFLIHLDLTGVGPVGSTPATPATWYYGDYVVAGIHRFEGQDRYLIAGICQRFAPDLAWVNNQYVYRVSDPQETSHYIPFIQVGFDGSSLGMYTLQLSRLDFLFYQHDFVVGEKLLLSWEMNYASRVSATDTRAYTGTSFNLHNVATDPYPVGADIGFRSYEDGSVQADHAVLTLGFPVWERFALGAELQGGYHWVDSRRVSGYKADFHLGTRRTRMGVAVQRDSADPMTLTLPGQTVVTFYYVVTNLF